MPTTTNASHLLSQLQIYRKDPQAPESKTIEAKVRAIGPDAIAILLRCVSKEGYSTSSADAASHAAEIKSNRLYAMSGFRILGSSAKSAVPELVKLMEDADWIGDPRFVVANCLDFIGPDAAPAIPSALANAASEREDLKLPSLITLSGVGRNSVECSKAVMGATSDAAAKVRNMAISRLRRMTALKEVRDHLSAIANDDRRPGGERFLAQLSLNPDILSSRSGHIINIPEAVR